MATKNPEVEQKRQRAVELRAAGLTLRAIGKVLGVSGERVRQLLVGTSQEGWQPKMVTQRQFYKTWVGARRRAKDAGVEFQWATYDEFEEWCQSHWFDGGVLDRADDSGPFGPDNCRFMTFVQSCQKRADLYEAFGEWKTLREWGDDIRCAVSYNTLKQRVGVMEWPIELALTSAEWAHIRRYDEGPPPIGRFR